MILVVLAILASRPVIDFLEELVVLFDQSVVWLQLQRLFIRDSRLFEIALMLVRNGEVVECLRVFGVDLYSPLPPVNRLAPQTPLCDRDAELDLLFCVGARVSGQRGGRCSEHKKKRQGTNRHQRSVPIYAKAPGPPSPNRTGCPAPRPSALPEPATSKRAARRRVEQG